MKKIFKENLPYIKTKNKYVINWENTKGSTIKFIYNDIEGEIEILNYYIERNQPRLKVKYNNKEFNITVAAFSAGNLKSIIYYIPIGKKIKDSKRNLIVLGEEYKNRIIKGKEVKTRYLKVKCNICGWDEGIMREEHLIEGKGCACCSGKIIVENINSLYATDNWIINLGVSEEDAKKYSKGSEQKIKVNCPHCKKTKTMKLNNIYRNKSIRCSCTSKAYSYPEKLMITVLEQLNIKYITQLSKVNFKWINNYRYDFYIPDYNIIIETHGKQHYKEVEHFKNSLKETQLNDINKEMLARYNGIDNYIILDCRESNLKYIKNSILNSELSCIFDLSKINWEKCEEYIIYKKVV